ncbi:MAG: RNA polymerase sigma factor [Bacteroidia bacterium]
MNQCLTAEATTVQLREALFTELYITAFPGAASYISRRGGSFEEASELFQEAVVRFYEQRLKQPGLAEGREAAYLGGIVRHLWIKQLSEKQRVQRLGKQELHTTEKPEEQAAPGRIEQLLNTVGRKCLELLRAFYFEQQKPEEIAGSFGFSGKRSATVQKFKCLEKVRNVVKEKKLQYADFIQ